MSLYHKFERSLIVVWLKCIVERVNNNGSITETFNVGHLTIEGKDAYCIDINTAFKNGYKTRADASTRMSSDQISDVALSIEYVKEKLGK